MALVGGAWRTVAVAGLALVAGCSTALPAAAPVPAAARVPAAPASPPSVRAPAPAPGSALGQVRRLVVKGRAPKTGYRRAAFGPAWTDTDRNGCDTRNDVLRRDLTEEIVKAGTHGCVVLAGRLTDPYTGRVIDFVRGGAAQVDIDHVVALSDAWQKGAAGWPAGKRLAFANDPLNLLAVDRTANRAKGDGDAATWLPANRGYRCAYAARQVAVKVKYQVWVTAAEQAALTRILAGCPTQPLPASSTPTLAPVAAPSPAPQPAPAAPQPGLDPRYPYCKDLPAGLGPYYRGRNPEYDWYRDADQDGVVCE